MKIKIDTKEDSQDEIRKAIKVLQFLIGDLNLSGQKNSDVGEAAQNAFSGMFSDNSAQQSQAQVSTYSDNSSKAPEAKSESTDYLFADLFSDNEIAQMKHSEEEPEEELPKGKKAEIELY